MTVSPTWATMPPSTDGSTTTLTSTCLPVASPSASARRLRWSSVRGAHLDELADDGRQLAGPTRADHHRHQGRGGRRRLAAQQVLHDLLAPAGRDARVGERVAQLVVPLKGLREAEQLVFDLTEGALGPGHPEEGLGVGERAVVCHLGVCSYLAYLVGVGARPLMSAAPPPG